MQEILRPEACNFHLMTYEKFGDEPYPFDLPYILTILTDICWYNKSYGIKEQPQQSQIYIFTITA